MGQVDFGRHSDDYAAYRPGPPDSFYERLDAVITIRGSRSVDLGTGPGLIALALAARGSSVVGLDLSPRQIATAQRVAMERGLAHAVHFAVARAESTGLPAAAFDLITAAQCWHWFDRERALLEVRRILRPGGILSIIHYSYLARRAPVVRETEELILEFNPSWDMAGSTGMYPGYVDEVIDGGLALVEQFCYDHDEEFSHERWRGRMRTCHGVGSGGLSPDQVGRFDQALDELLRTRYPEPLVIPHRVWCTVARSNG